MSIVLTTEQREQAGSDSYNRFEYQVHGELFFMFCDDIQDMHLINALQGLMSRFAEVIYIQCSTLLWL